MKIQLLCFAAMKDFFPAHEDLTLEGVHTLSDLKLYLQNQNPKASSLLKISRFAINQTIVSEEESIFDGAVIAVLPPSSGG
ncbi:MoaD/ThiS family protein [Leptospira ilyithenensis]|uniref:MoaD/ThiS family protein n=1 Tax=Leptospira ilyithenensis TaxID=2484901 RepID=A0A4R9LR94_9LEPT|nr:MoaD/ThiS family protein [Leptospira ilyithenensis]TGN08500.1 MoaD/ThiS family protein [Leptospira ilyithenensis]